MLERENKEDSKREELSRARRRGAVEAAEQGWKGAVAPCWREGWWQAARRHLWSWWASPLRGYPAAEVCPEDPKKMGGQGYLASPPAKRKRKREKKEAAADLGKGCNGLQTEWRDQVAPCKE